MACKKCLEEKHWLKRRNINWMVREPSQEKLTFDQRNYTMKPYKRSDGKEKEKQKQKQKNSVSIILQSLEGLSKTQPKRR